MNRNFYARYKLKNDWFLKEGMVMTSKGSSVQYTIEKITKNIIYLKQGRTTIMVSRDNIVENYVLVKFLNTRTFQEQMLLSPNDITPERIDEEENRYGYYKCKYVISPEGKIFKVVARARKDSFEYSNEFYLDDGEGNVTKTHFNNLLKYKIIDDKYIHLIEVKR